MFKFIKSFFKQEDFESIEELEEELMDLKKHSNALMISFVGVDDKIKGVDLIHFSDESNDTRLLAGIFANFFDNLKILQDNFLKATLIPNVIKTKQRILVYYPITPTVVIICILPDSNGIIIVSKWILKNEDRLKQYFKT